jgi:hypothetical protein
MAGTIGQVDPFAALAEGSIAIVFVRQLLKGVRA